MTEQEIRIKALELAVEYSKGFNNSIESAGSKYEDRKVLDVVKKFEKYIKDCNQYV